MDQLAAVSERFCTVAVPLGENHNSNSDIGGVNSSCVARRAAPDYPLMANTLTSALGPRYANASRT